jgi:lipopolysaccharide export system protein LptC
MKRIALTAALLATFGLAAAATAGEQQKPRTAAVYGRNLVWQEAKTEQPYALRGQPQDAKAQKPRIELQSHGRQGTTVEINRANDR